MAPVVLAGALAVVFLTAVRIVLIDNREIGRRRGLKNGARTEGEVEMENPLMIPNPQMPLGTVTWK